MSVSGPPGSVVANFHRLYYDSESTWHRTYWMGVLVQKCPLDLWMYQEILHETRPELIIETGSFEGGSALYLASILDILGSGEVLSIDIDDRPRPDHPRVTFRLGSSIDPNVIEWAAGIADGRRTMVILDSDHSERHVAAELDAYASLVTPDCYLIVEDTNIDGHPVYPTFGPGPAEALRAWLPLHREFQVDRHRERLLLTFNPGGYLKRL